MKERCLLIGHVFISLSQYLYYIKTSIYALRISFTGVYTYTLTVYNKGSVSFYL